MKQIIYVICMLFILPISSLQAEDRFEYSILTVWEMNSKDYSKTNNGIIIIFDQPKDKQVYVEKASTTNPDAQILQHFAVKEFLSKRESKVLSQSSETKYSFLHLLTELGLDGWDLSGVKTIDKSDKLNGVVKTDYYFKRKFPQKTNKTK